MNLDYFNNFLSKPINNNSENSFIKNFLSDLKDSLVKKQSFDAAKELSLHTILNFAKYDGNYAVCFDNNSKNIYYIPKDNIIGTKPEPGEVLKINSPGKFYVDYTGIPVKENLIEQLLNSCKIAK